MKKLIAYGIFALAAVFIVLSLWAVSLVKNLPSVEELDSRQISQSTKIYDRTGTILLYEINGSERRTIVPLGDMPQYLKKAALAAEDENFYSEPAFDWLAILRAVAVNLVHGRILQGGSTITQQLAKNAFLSPEQTFSRKIKEFMLAIKLDRRYSKDQILEFYLNEIPYGSMAYGAEAASETYFGKSARGVDLAEAAMLAALPRAPTYYSPYGSHYRELIGRQQYVLKRMRQLNEISGNELKNALAEKINFVPQSERTIKAPHFVMAAQDYLVQKYGDDLVRKGGLKVTTTLDWNLQQSAEKAVAEGAQRNESLYQGKNAALAAEDPQTGQILSLVGSRDYFDIKNEGNFDVAVQGLRQPGSALKPFVYLTAMEKGYTPNTVVFDTPTEFSANNPTCPAEVDFNNDDPQCFHPQNFDEKFRGPVSFRNALAQSINVPAVKVLYLAGVNDTLKNLHSFGITTLNDPQRYGLSLTLGGGEVKLIDLVSAYSVLAQEGMRHRQSMILEVDDGQGNVLEKYQDQPEQVVDPEYPRLIDDILSDEEARAPLYQASLGLTNFSGHDVALKTGTSNDYRDAWSIGYTPSLVVGVWAGNNDNSPMQKHGSSILAAVPIWHDFMAQALQNDSLKTFSQPDEKNGDKPILNGDYLAGNQIHSLLYYVRRDDPLGPPPDDPASDPQFNNWENSVLGWAKENINNFSEYNQASSSMPLETGAQPLSVVILNPSSGSFIGDQVNLSARAKSPAGVKEIDVYFNNQLVKSFSGNFGGDYALQWSFAPENPQPQNLISIKAIDQNNNSIGSQVIVYKQ